MVKNQSTPTLSYLSPTDSSSRLSSTTKQPPAALPTVINHRAAAITKNTHCLKIWHS
ncbi:hypothetical protein Peur_028025 [Populus x canadensis]